MSTSNARPNANAFTLIEMIIALALGATLCMTTFSVVRVASQSVTVANQMSVENQLFRAGLSVALEDIDFWYPYDHPSDVTQQPLRSTAVPLGSNPFRPMTIDARFDQSTPKTWWRGLPVGNFTKRFGDYSMFAKCGYASVPAKPTGDAMRRWLPETFKRINDTLGHFALIDYLPANSMYQYFDDSGSGDRDGQIPDEFLQCNGIGFDATSDPRTNPRMMMPTGGFYDIARDIEFLTFSAAFPITANEEYLAKGVNRGAFADYYLSGMVTDDWRTTKLHEKCSHREQVQDLHPKHWPDVKVDLRRFFYHVRSLTLSTITMGNPLTGAVTKMQLSAVGTTLRGARQQRGLDTYLAATGIP